MTDALKPCPFCGGNNLMAFPPTCGPQDAYDASDRVFPLVRCMTCYAEAPGENFPPGRSASSAVVAWNRRADLGRDKLLKAVLSIFEGDDAPAFMTAHQSAQSIRAIFEETDND